jgi:hypothetical protein
LHTLGGCGIREAVAASRWRRILTQQDPIGIAGGLNLYGFADADPVNFGDPFGLNPCEDKDRDPRCEEGAILVVSINASATIPIGLANGLAGTKTRYGPLGANMEIGVATNLDTGVSSDFVRFGPSVGKGAAVGIEIVLQDGTIMSAVGQDAAEFEYDGALGGVIGINLPSRYKDGFGIGANVGLGRFIGINGTKTSWVGPGTNRSQQVERCHGTALGLGGGFASCQ